MPRGSVREPARAAEPVFDAVIAAARTGADWALAALYRQFQPAILRYLRARVPGQEEDVASDVWLAAARGLSGFEGGESDFGRWIFTIARRRAVDLGRKSQRRRTDAADPEDFANVAGGVDPQEALAARAAGDDAVARIVALLPKAQADVVLLRVVAGLSVTEVAEVLGCSANRVSVTQHRALHALARKLGPGGALSWIEDSRLDLKDSDT
jgi:RNA polymerase sigma-70 factor (ECF subfamily)